ncbi:MAG: pyridoxamine 5'-phosphate oxidase family protein [Gammaproteobacteria bacterium]|nr:pyridoxamine 5'-phosphate oxidase family protein [Gammaproteobacteria bacterium]
MARLNALQSEDELRGYFPISVERAKLKVLDGLDRHCIDFIARSPFLCIGTSRPDGCADVSPRGDPPGFVHVADANTLLIPDRPGNNRLDTMSNIMHNPKVGLLFFIPGLGETLRVNGDARIIDDAAELARFEFRRHIPKVAIAVTVREAFIHCAKAIRRSRLWEEDAKIDPKSFTRIGDIISDHIKGRKSGDEIEEILKENYRTQMY